jgi:hypothetical protein
LSAGFALTRNRQPAAIVEPEPSRATVGAALPDPDLGPTPQNEPSQPSEPNEPNAAVEPAADDRVVAPSGEVLEALPVANYTYLRLKSAQGEVWAAVPLASLRVHDHVQLTGVSLMRDFTSKTLKRTFASIYFGNLAGAPPPETNGGALPAGHPRVDAL